MNQYYSELTFANDRIYKFSSNKNKYKKSVDTNIISSLCLIKEGLKNSVFSKIIDFKHLNLTLKVEGNVKLLVVIIPFLEISKNTLLYCTPYIDLQTPYKSIIDELLNFLKCSASNITYVPLERTVKENFIIPLEMFITVINILLQYSNLPIKKPTYAIETEVYTTYNNAEIAIIKDGELNPEGIQFITNISNYKFKEYIGRVENRLISMDNVTSLLNYCDNEINMLTTIESEKGLYREHVIMPIDDFINKLHTNERKEIILITRSDD